MPIRTILLLSRNNELADQGVAGIETQRERRLAGQAIVLAIADIDAKRIGTGVRCCGESPCRGLTVIQEQDIGAVARVCFDNVGISAHAGHAWSNQPP
jgi:hypothetical protein